MAVDGGQPACLRRNLGQAALLLKVLANRERFLLLARLARAECDVGQLASELGIGKQSVSQQLAVLRRAQLVATRRDGKHIYYKATGSEAPALIALFQARRAGEADSA